MHGDKLENFYMRREYKELKIFWEDGTSAYSWNKIVGLEIYKINGMNTQLFRKVQELWNEGQLIALEWYTYDKLFKVP